MSFTSTFIFLAGGGLAAPPLFSSDIDDDEFEFEDDADKLNDEVAEEFCDLRVDVVLLFAVVVGGVVDGGAFGLVGCCCCWVFAGICGVEEYNRIG
jgi:hypothetical protein